MKKPKKPNPGIIFVGMGFEAVAIIVGSVFLGQAVDKAMGWNGLGVAGLILLAMLGWFIHLFMMLKRFMKNSPSPPDDLGETK